MEEDLLLLSNKSDHNLTMQGRIPILEYHGLFRNDFGIGAVIEYENEKGSLYLVFHLARHLYKVQNIKDWLGRDQDYYKLKDGYRVIGYIHNISDDLTEYTLRDTIIYDSIKNSDLLNDYEFK